MGKFCLYGELCANIPDASTQRRPLMRRDEPCKRDAVMYACMRAMQDAMQLRVGTYRTRIQIACTRPYMTYDRPSNNGTVSSRACDFNEKLAPVDSRLLDIKRAKFTRVASVFLYDRRKSSPQNFEFNLYSEFTSIHRRIALCKAFKTNRLFVDQLNDFAN